MLAGGNFYNFFVFACTETLPLQLLLRFLQNIVFCSTFKKGLKMARWAIHIIFGKPFQKRPNLDYLTFKKAKRQPWKERKVQENVRDKRLREFYLNQLKSN